MEMRINAGSGCKNCDDITTTANGSHCNSGTVVVIRWNNVCTIALYFVEFVILVAVFLCLMYFWKNKKSPLVKSCYSCPDDVTLAILSLFCLLPVLHVGELSTERCMVLSPVVNIILHWSSFDQDAVRPKSSQMSNRQRKPRSSNGVLRVHGDTSSNRYRNVAVFWFPKSRALFVSARSRACARRRHPVRHPG